MKSPPWNQQNATWNSPETECKRGATKWVITKWTGNVHKSLLASQCLEFWRAKTGVESNAKEIFHRDGVEWTWVFVIAPWWCFHLQWKILTEDLVYRPVERFSSTHLSLPQPTPTTPPSTRAPPLSPGGSGSGNTHSSLPFLYSCAVWSSTSYMEGILLGSSLK